MAIGVFNIECGADIISTLFKHSLIKVESNDLFSTAMQLSTLHKYALLFFLLIILFLSCMLNLIAV